MRRITINASKVTPDEGIYEVIFTDTKKLEREKNSTEAMLGIKNKYGKNAVLKASYEEGATMRRRNAADRRSQRRRFGGRFRWKTTKIAKSGGRPPKSTGTSWGWNAPDRRIPPQAPRMTLQNRAKIFSPFSPLRGYGRQLAA